MSKSGLSNLYRKVHNYLTILRSYERFRTNDPKNSASDHVVQQ